MRSAAIPAFLRDMDFTDVSWMVLVDARLTEQIRFLGGKLGNAMATEYGAKTVGDMLYGFSRL
jgi:DNA polymerase eta